MPPSPRPGPRPRPPDPDPALVRRVTSDLAALHDMSLAQLRARYEALYGEPSLSRNAAWLRKKLAWRIQELAYGGLSDTALSRIDEVLAWMDREQRSPVGNGRRQATLPEKLPTPKVVPPPRSRDARLPPPGTVLSRDHQGVVHEVTVQDDGFTYRGSDYDSLSAIATVIAGTRWNGFRFFGLTGPWSPVQATDAADAAASRGAA